MGILEGGETFGEVEAAGASCRTRTAVEMRDLPGRASGLGAAGPASPPLGEMPYQNGEPGQDGTSKGHASDEMVAGVPRLRMPEPKREPKDYLAGEEARGSRAVWLAMWGAGVRMNPDPMYCT